MDDVENTIDVLKKLHGSGIGVSLDNFGTSCFSLFHLQRLPLHTLKIDRSFVRSLTTGEGGSSGAIICSIIALAKSLGLNVIAEGVETRLQSEFLQDHDCHNLQGFFYSRPVDSQSCTRFIRQRTPRIAQSLEFPDDIALSLPSPPIQSAISALLELSTQKKLFLDCEAESV